MDYFDTVNARQMDSTLFSPPAYQPPNAANYNPIFKVGDNVSFKKSPESAEELGKIENIQYIIRPESSDELLPVDLQYISYHKPTGGRRTRRNRRNRKSKKRY